MGSKEAGEDSQVEKWNDKTARIFQQSGANMVMFTIYPL